MSDRTSAAIFGELFVMFAEDAMPTDREYARKVWAMTWEYDFSFEQMECNEELVRLELASAVVDGSGFPCYKYADSTGRL